MKSLRWPALVLFPTLLALMVLTDEVSTPPDPSTTTTVPDATTAPEVGRDPDPLPLAPAADAPASRWFCPAGTGGGNDLVERSVVVVANTTARARRGTLSLFGPAGPLTERQIEVPAYTRWQLGMDRLTDQTAVAALVELDGGGVGVAQVLEGPHGRTVTTCPTAPSSTWYLPAAATTLDARAVLTVFNPFPDDAIVEIAFTDRDGVRVPTGFDAFPVPPSSVVQLDLTDTVTVRPQFTTSVEATSGQVVAAMVQQYDGTGDVEGLAVGAGAPAGATEWVFPAGLWEGDSVRETYVIQNPGSTDAQVDVSVGMDEPEVNGAVAPFEVTVPAESFVVLSSTQEQWRRVPEGVGHHVIVRSVGGEGVVALQRRSVVGEERPGMAMTLGAPLAARNWIVPVLDLEDTVVSVTIMNPDPESLSQAEVVALAGGERLDLEGVELGAAARVALLPARGLPLETAAALVTSTTPTVVSSAWTLTPGRGLAVAIPVTEDETGPAPG